MTPEEALKLALAALETEQDIYRENDEDGAPEHILEAIIAIKEALAQPKQEPVAWRWKMSDVHPHLWEVSTKPHKMALRAEPLYTTPPQRTWVGLTEREQGAIMEDLNAHGTNLYPFAQAIEAKLKEKNT